MKAIPSPRFVAPRKTPWELSVALWAPWHPARTTQLETESLRNDEDHDMDVAL